MQDPQVVADRSCRRRRCQMIVGHAKAARRKQLGPVAIPGKCARLAHQPIDYVPVVDAVLVPALQARLNFLLSWTAPHFDRVGMDPHLHPLADQPGRHRVDVALDRDRAARLHAHAHLPKRLQPPRRQCIQIIAFVMECLLSLGIAAIAQRAQERHIGFLARKIVAAAQEQRLLDRPLEAVMALLAIAVLVTRVGIDRLRPHSVVRHQRLIAAREELRPRSLHRQRHAIAAMTSRHAAQRPHRILEPFAKTLEALGETERHVLPVRMRQHEVVDQVLERLAVDGHAQLGHVREVGSTELARRMLLREEDLLVGPTPRLPFVDAPLQGPQLPVGESAWMAPLQFFEERLGLPARSRFEQLFDFVPHVRERIGTRPPGPRRRRLHPLRRQPIRVPILPSGFAIHARLRRRKTQRRLLAEPGPHRPDLFIRDHHRATPLPGGGARSVNRPRDSGER